MNQEKRRFRLFPRTLNDVVRQATKPVLDQQGKLIGALVRDWSTIVGERARVTRPERVQFSTKQDTATLYVDTSPAMAPELAYAAEQMIEQCNRYFGHRAISRIVFNPVHGLFTEAPPPPTTTAPLPRVPLPDNLPRELKDIFDRMAKKLE